MSEAQELADRYVAVWNETDADKRRQAIAALWAPDGQHYVRTLEVRGYAALEQRVTGSYEKNVRDAGYRFRSVKNAQALRNVLMLHWEMLPAGGGAVAAGGIVFLILNDAGRISCDYQFMLS